jgi:hypothetical protein
VAREKCTARSSRTGDRCKRWPVAGGTVCPSHGGRAPQVRDAAERRQAEARIRAELGDLADFRAGDAGADPIETLLRLLTQSRRRADLYAELLQQQYERAAEDPDGDDRLPVGIKALIGHKRAVAGEGYTVPVEEAVRALVGLEADERDRCARYSKLALDAKVDERMTTLQETQAALVADALGAALAELGLSHEDQRRASAALARHLRSVPR